MKKAIRDIMFIHADFVQKLLRSLVHDKHTQREIIMKNGSNTKKEMIFIKSQITNHKIFKIID